MPTSADHIIAYLERLRQKPGMYIGSDISRLLPHQHGFQAGCAIHGFQKDATIYAAVMREHGWHPPAAMALCTYLIEQGHDYSFNGNEVITIEIETWRRTYPDAHDATPPTPASIQ
jgi:hypothetical protein